MTEQLVLIVDDDDEFREMVALVVAASGYRTAEATDGVDALAQLEGGIRPALILLDLRMPRLNGLEFLDRLDAGLRGSIPVVVLTGDATGSRAATRAGATAVLSKPVESRVLLRTIEQHVA